MIAGTTVNILRLHGRFGESELLCNTRVINCRPLFGDAIILSSTQLYFKVNTCEWNEFRNTANEETSGMEIPHRTTGRIPV